MARWIGRPDHARQRAGAALAPGPVQGHDVTVEAENLPPVVVERQPLVQLVERGGAQ